ncbi:MAG TPA: HD domain-containing phosphohydrolase [Dongiaceae bacterium]|nr:HD domain-containing phosphohydrolase [Dongiaceae bacterium]
MMATILFVDDEAGIRSALRRLFADLPYRLLFAADAAEGLALLRANECAVIVSDVRMPGESGIELLSRARLLVPDTVRVMMSAYADLSTALNAINRCEAFRFVVKPWDDQELVEVVGDGVLRYDLQNSLRHGDEAIYRTLAQTIELKDHYTRGHCDRVVDSALAIGRRVGLSMEALTHIGHGAMLHDCGKIGVPEATLNFPGRLDNEQLDVVHRHPGWGADIARTAGMHQSTVNVILHHHEHYDGLGYPSGLAGEDIPLEARIVAVADVYDALTSDRPYRKAMPSEAALQEFMSLSGTVLDPYFVEIFIEIVKEQSSKRGAE